MISGLNLSPAAEPRLIPPDRATAELSFDDGGKVAREIALLRRVANENIGHARRLRSKGIG
jgi:hypothetical protein